MYCTNDGKHPLSGSIGGEPIGHPVGGRDLHTHDLYGEKDAELHFWDGRESGTNQNTTPVSTVLHSPEPATADHEPKIRFQQRHQIQVGRSPVGSGGHNGSSDSTTASSPVLMQQCHHSTVSAASNIVLMPSAGSHVYSTQSILADGEIVVFDDIEPNWASGGSGVHGSEMSILMGGGTTPSKETHTADSSNKIQTIIGGLTIAEYEGSPRRFGTIYSNNYSTPDGTIRPGSNSFPRPGFPKRVETMASDDGQPRLIELGGKSNEAGNFYNKTNTMAGNDMNFQIDTKYFNCKQQVALEEDLIPAGSTSSIIKPHSFVLSPETDYRPRSFDRAKSGGISVKSDAKEILNEPCVEYEDMCNSMPILEDGLSSGHASDSEGNTVTNSCDGNGSGGRGEEAFGSLGLHMVRSDQHYHHHQQHHSTHGSAYDGSVHVQNGRDCLAHDIREALNDIKSTLQNTKTLPADERREAVDQNGESFAPYSDDSPVWVLRTMDRLPEEQENAASSSNPSERHTNAPELEDETDTDLETDRLLGHQQNAGEQNYYEHSSSTEMGGFAKPKSPNSSATLAKLKRYQTAIRADSEIYVPSDITLENLPEIESKGRHKTREGLLDPAVLIEGVLFRARYLGSTQLVCEGQPTKSTRMMQAEEAVSRIKALAPAGESQPSTEVDLFISTEKIMVLNTDLKEIMMDHALRTISYIADIGQLVVLMARRRFVATGPGAPVADGATDDAGGNNASGTDVPQQDTGTGPPNTTTTDNTSPKKRTGNRTPKMICHVFESEEAQFIAQSIGQAFQVAYMEFLKANGIEDHSFMKELDYQEVLNSQEIFGDELEIFAKKELQKEVVVPKAKGEILGVVIVESGWGSMLPTVVIANLASSGAAARCGQLNIGDQIIAINGLSLVGLPLSTCQGYIKNTKNQTVVKFTVVPCAPVVEVKIKRPNTKYQLGFSVQNGVICSLLRGGIAERGGVRVGHRIIEINNQSVVAVPHEKIVNLLATSIGEILMKTMPTSMFRLLTGQENPIYI
ncbi:amyloid-beta A4 precursor protein-binding family A member 2-like isoform X1 [Anopheles stephensi]|nr:amyloid-beta A4 precursor protein-binding family A member 2-like isoform X1 [Anopheles stephensi]